MTLILTKLAFYRSMLLKLDSFWINSTWKRIDLLVGMTKKSWLIIFTVGSLNWTYINHTGHTFDTLDIRRVTLLKTLGYAQTLWWRKSAQIAPGRIICQNLQKQNGAWLPPRQTEGSRNPKNIWRMAISKIYLSAPLESQICCSGYCNMGRGEKPQNSHWDGPLAAEHL